MPKNNIQRAIKKGTGELEGFDYVEVTYEGYGPGGVAVLVDTITDNKQRTVADVRHIFSKRGGNLGEPGSVAWIFRKTGLIVVEKNDVDEDALMSAAIEAGADDIEEQKSEWEIYCGQENLEVIKAALESQGIKWLSAEVTMMPSTTIKIEDEKLAGQILTLMEALEDYDDVQNVYANFDIPDEILEKTAQR